MIKCITFDLDDTLWAVDPVVDQANHTLFEWLAENAAPFGELYKSSDWPQLRRTVMQAKPEISHSVTLIRMQVMQHALEKAGFAPDQATAIAEKGFEVFHEARQQVEFFEHALGMLQQLKDKGYQLGALSNGNADIHKVGLGHLMDFGLNADQVGEEKPHPLMFEQMLQQNNLRPEQVIHIGDNPVADVEGADNLGIWTIWVNLDGSDAEVKASRTVHCLSQIPAMIEDIAKEAGERFTL